ncbi:MAG: TolC family protein [Fuerstiella sp.]
MRATFYILTAALFCGCRATTDTVMREADRSGGDGAVRESFQSAIQETQVESPGATGSTRSPVHAGSDDATIQLVSAQDAVTKVAADEPDTDQPRTALPGKEVPDTAIPDSAQTDAAQTDAEQTDAEQTDAVSPDAYRNSQTGPGLMGDSAEALSVVLFEQVIASVHQSYPLVEAAFQERQVASGNLLSAWGEFDTKLKASSENGPLGYYETYRNSAGISTPLYQGGEVFGGYRNGGGDFQPWYKERETNDGGEFKAGVRVPLIRDRDIDARRAALWRSSYDQQIADPVIQASLVEFSFAAGLAYWKWVAAGQKYQLGREWLELAKNRNSAIERRVQLQDLDPPELVDNERAIAKREAKLADALREVQQAAVKLSLFLRDESGLPQVPEIDQIPGFPALRNPSSDQITFDIRQAAQNRPELTALDLQLQRLRVDYAEACNMTRPGLDAQIAGSQDVGQPTSSKRDKSEFELEAALFFDVPLERRKGRGKMQAVQAKIAQVTAKRRLVQDKVAAEVQSVYAGLIQTRLEALKARRAVELASRMADIERRKFEVGESDLLKVALREQYTIEAAEEEIAATYRHFVAVSEYAATMAVSRPSADLLPTDGGF